MKNHFLSLVAAIAATFCLVAFAPTAEAQPSKNDLKTSLLQSIPPYLQIETFTIDATQNLGNKVDPDYAVRFTASVVNVAPLFHADGTEDSILFVRLRTAAGTKTAVYGRMRSVLFQGAWRNQVSIDGDPVAHLGLPLAHFGGARVIIRGSDNERRFNLERGYSVTKSTDGTTWTVTFLTDNLITIPHTKGRRVELTGVPDGAVQWPNYQDRSRFLPIPLGTTITLQTGDLEMKYKAERSVIIHFR